MQVETKYFGTIEVADDNIIYFEDGIFGFGDNKKYAVIYDNEEGIPLISWLQSIQDAEVVLPMISTALIFSDYNPEIDDEHIKKIGNLSQENLLLYTIIVVPGDIKNITTNLRAPIIINTKTKKGIQVILEDEIYPIKYNLYEELQSLKSKGGE